MPFHRNECIRGLLLRPLVALTWLLIFVVALACEGGLPAPTPLPDVQHIPKESGKAMALLESFQFDMNHRNGGTPIAEGLVITEVVGNVVKPDKLELSWEGTFEGYFVRAQVITLEGKTYMTDPITGLWGALPGDVNPLGFFDPTQGIASIMQELRNMFLVGVETYGGRQTYRLKGELPSGSLAPLLGTAASDLMVDTEVWIEVENMHLLQVVFQGRVTSKDPKDIKRTIKLSNFNQLVTIEAPPLE